MAERAGEPDVLVIGGGAVGTMLACDLLQQGVSVRVVDRKEVLDDGDPHSRAVLIWPRMLELLHRIGVVDDLVSLGFRITGVGYFSGGRRLGTVPMDRLGTALPFTLSLPQREIEKVLRRRFADLGGVYELGTTLEAIDPDGPAVELRGADGVVRTARPKWVIGSDGVGSTTRRLLEVPYPGKPFELGISIGDFPVSGPLGTEVEYHYSRNGLLPMIPMTDGVGRMASIVPPVGDGWESFTREQLQEIVNKRASLPYRIGEPKWIRTFQPRPGIAERFRIGRTFLVGDSAHCVVPLGGQGLNLGIQDAFNLGWKLGGVIRGRLPEPILDTYDAERRRAAQQVTAVVDKQILAARQVKPLPSLVRDVVVSTARVTGMLEKVAAPLIGGVGLAYGKPQQRSLLRPQPKRVRPGQRVPFHSTNGPRIGRGLLDPERFTALLWPGAATPGAWAEDRAEVTALLDGTAAVCDLAGLPARERAGLVAVFGRRPVVALVRPDGHLAALAPVSRPQPVLSFLATATTARKAPDPATLAG
ncbi:MULTISPECIES: FAD-dependent monooxygenase [Saccharothrix]|uniref:FAD-dependent monooxygenase n=1 Tax=Saccharothrix TaxID=2071 RepID=UPI000ABB6505|nr:FAD-dependent monooxygenase [Saccharothrix sp. CB00851]